jgi:magnesium and cobalt exporter, CNNM family
METIWVELVLIAVAILANGFFAGSEIALISARISRLAQLRQEAVTGAAKVMRLKESPEGFLATIQIAITAVGTLASAVGGATAIEALTPWLAGLELPGATEWAEPVALGIVILAITYVSLVVGELVPKAVALRNPERMACLVAPAILWLSRAASVLVRALTVSTSAVLRVLGQGRVQQSPFISEEEVRYLVREGTAKGIFEKVEEELVHNVFEFADTTVREIMTPRPHIQGLDIATPAAEVLQKAVEIGHSRIPVYRDSTEQPVGIILMKDLLRAAAQGTAPSLPELIRQPLFIPENAPISFLLKEFQRHRQNLALVVDEYGGVVGLVTLEDVLEEIVGEIHEEGEAAAPPFAHRLPDGSYVLDGLAPIHDVQAQLALPIEESEAYRTVAGFLINALQAIPKPGASVTAGGHRWTVVEMDGPKIVKVKVEREGR